jgi:CHAD domain-containing protein
MAKIYPVNKKLSLKENIQNILPLMFDELMKFKNDVASKPMAKNTLHRMRIAGKPLRYAMEIGEAAFGNEFTACFEEVKTTVELMGEIHDADVMIPEMNSHLHEIRMFNQTLPVFSERISTKPVRDIVSGMMLKRKAMYDKLCLKLNEWEKLKFKNRLIIAMGLQPPDNFVTAGGI